MNIRKNEDDKKCRPWDDVFGSFDEEFEGMRERMDRLMEQLTTGAASLDSEPMIYSFSMRVGSDEKPLIQQFRNTAVKDEASSIREPLTDVIEEKDKMRVVVELPGVEKEEIHLHATARALDIEVDGQDRKFSKHLDLPCEIKGDNAKATYKNGVLQILLERSSRRKKKKDIGIE
ncbi:MAG: archaeal heat shock protein Hsp20 [Methanomassiliicoccales archaeon]|jgi:HSP20 family protein